MSPPAASPVQLLILIPAYNEQDRIGRTLEAYVAHFRQRMPGQFQILVVLNGCRDQTLDIVRAAQAAAPEIVYAEFPRPIGKGGALIEGLKHTHAGEYIGYVDADMATPPEALGELFEACRGKDAVIGSRWVAGAKLHKLQSLKRRIASRGFHWIVELLFGLGIKDTQCGAKVFRSEAIAAIHNQLLISDMSFDVNLLVALKRAGFTIHEIPTEWTDQTGSKVRLFKTSLRMLLSVIRLRIIYSPLEPLRRRMQPLETWLFKVLSPPRRPDT